MSRLRNCIMLPNGRLPPVFAFATGVIAGPEAEILGQDELDEMITVEMTGRMRNLGLAILLAAISAGGLGYAQTAETKPATEPYPDFTFKRIGASTATGQKRITVQIDPEEQRKRLASALPPPEHPIPRGGVAPGLVPDGSSAIGDYHWYWQAVSPALGDGAGRFSTALTALAHGPDGSIVPAPRLQHLQDIAEVHGTEIMKATIGTEVSPALVLAVIGIESAGRIDAKSSAGAVGLMQLIPATAERFGVEDSVDAGQNIKGGVAYLDWLMKEFNRDPVMVLAAYNAGENAVKSNGGVPPYAETRAYVPKVLAAWAVARGLCITPPELTTDGCVFAVKG